MQTHNIYIEQQDNSKYQLEDNKDFKSTDATCILKYKGYFGEKIPKIDSSDGYTTKWMYLMPLRTLKMAKNAHYM